MKENLNIHCINCGLMGRYDVHIIEAEFKGEPIRDNSYYLYPMRSIIVSMSWWTEYRYVCPCCGHVNTKIVTGFKDFREKIEKNKTPNKKTLKYIKSKYLH